ncbi:plasmid partitioning protein RepB [Rhizobium pusense]|nr:MULTISPECIES: plasmid partitioning protein RepB [Hyphomicrobiales]QCM13540.1 plasmid partitioning protein RepB [Agrobacterium tumefaciens]KAB2701530.1 plasmid partitioning protein RepB [Brucella lupini]MDH0912443.1 plasmid partitioning protein RepB [Agrobacterium pusense]MDH1098549.1 plasmid partitioning protein RepB [Agrobacterium pusense]MDH1115259.1 plasmid partitioning protein RepB [Agrobacterium pusense]
MARKHLLSELKASLTSTDHTGESTSTVAAPPHYAPRGAIGAVSRSIEALKSQGLTEIDPDLIDAPAVTDRLDEDDDQFEEFARNIRENGQQVPILVRPHPTIEGRYQIAYGRRRLRAVKAAGVKITAAIRSLTDDELVLAQGQENSARQDLSFIERALYAAQLEANGYQRSVIMAALAVDKSNLSRLIQAATQLPADVIRLIGAAPKTGRDRWYELSSRLSADGALETARALLSDKAIMSMASDERFARIFDAVAPKKTKSAKFKTEVWQADDGVKAASFRQDKKTLTLMIDKKAAPEFGEYLMSALPEIYASFKKTRQ